MNISLILLACVAYLTISTCDAGSMRERCEEMIMSTKGPISVPEECKETVIYGCEHGSIAYEWIKAKVCDKRKVPVVWKHFTKHFGLVEKILKWVFKWIKNPNECKPGAQLMKYDKGSPNAKAIYNDAMKNCVVNNKELTGYKDFCNFGEKDKPLASKIQGCIMPRIIPKIIFQAPMYLDAAKKCCKMGIKMVKELLPDCKEGKKTCTDPNLYKYVIDWAKKEINLAVTM